MSADKLEALNPSTHHSAPIYSGSNKNALEVRAWWSCEEAPRRRLVQDDELNYICDCRDTST